MGILNFFKSSVTRNGQKKETEEKVEAYTEEEYQTKASQRQESLAELRNINSKLDACLEEHRAKQVPRPSADDQIASP